MSQKITLDAKNTLPADGYAGTLAGRVWRPDVSGPSVVAIRETGVFDVTRDYATMRDLCEQSDPAAALATATGERLCSLDELLAISVESHRDPAKPWLLAPVDLHAVKAAGVTFPVSMIERVIEEKARGNADAAHGIRAEINRLVGGDLAKLKPGSEEAMALKAALIKAGAWSQYLEVGIGPDAEIFTKAPPMAAVGTGADAGLHPVSTWNNPEPEVVLLVASNGTITGAMLGNDVNLRDVEGRSALLLGKAKDNNAAASLGPFIRFFDSTFTLDDVRKMEVRLRVTGDDGFVLDGRSNMAMIARDPTELAGQLLGPHHQYPDGAVLYCGTMFAPVEDRGAKGQGFTHKLGDIVTISSDKLGGLTNRMRHSTECAPWTFGTGALMRNLAKRGLI
ncbi:MAG: fumarylacetoacetate hydrolase family protein [Beijerinckiaceae bacterium]